MKDYIVRKMKIDELSLVKKLYQLGFDDESANLPFEYRIIDNESCYVLQNGANIIGMIVAIPCSYKGEKGHQAYALTIDAKFRGKHLGVYLLDEMVKNRKAAGDKFSIMLPAYDGLYDYYSTLGYNAIAATSKIISQNENLICNNDLVEYTDNFKKYCLQSAICNGSYIQKDPCIICTSYDAESGIHTIFDCYPDIYGSIIYKLSFKSKIYLPDNNGKEKFGMIKNLDKTNRNGIFPWLTNK